MVGVSGALGYAAYELQLCLFSCALHHSRKPCIHPYLPQQARKAVAALFAPPTLASCPMPLCFPQVLRDGGGRAAASSFGPASTSWL